MNFQDALATDVTTIERPPNLPQGTYRWLVEKHPSMESIANDRFDVCDFQMKCIEAMEDVDPNDLKSFGDITNARMRHRFMFSREDETSFKRGMFNLKRFLTEHLGLPDEGSLKELLAQSVGHQCLGTVGWRPDKNDPEIQYAEIKSTAPVE